MRRNGGGVARFLLEDEVVEPTTKAPPRNRVGQLGFLVIANTLFGGLG
jgi:hypothetical protein